MKMTNDAELDELVRQIKQNEIQWRGQRNKVADAIQSLRQEVARLRLEVDQSGNWQAQTWAMKERADRAEAEVARPKEDAAKVFDIREFSRELERVEAERDALREDASDLAMMVKRLVRRLPADDIVAGQAMILLTKQHMTGSPMRDAEIDAARKA
jgi:hypothetical protein